MNEPFFGACRENTGNLLSAIDRFETVEEFLRDEDVRIPLFPTTVDDSSEDLTYSYDFDGIVVRMSNLAYINAPIHYLFVGKLDVSKLQNHWHILKKHMNLTLYTANGISALLKTTGVVLGFVDGGYFLNVSCRAKTADNAHPFFENDQRVRVHALGLLNALLCNFYHRLRACSPEDLERPTMMKNDLTNLKKLSIVRSDQIFILKSFMDSFFEVDIDPDMQLVLSLSRFGQKDEEPFDLEKVADPSGVLSISYHVACTVRSADPSVDLLFSRHGLQDVVGKRGNLFPVYSMSEACNFQSNLDHLPLDIDSRVVDIFQTRDKTFRLNFVQLYATTPHVHESSPVKHPISRIITTCGLHIEKHKQKLRKDAQSYFGHVDDLTRKTITRTAARIEAVFLTYHGFPTKFSASDFFRRDNMEILFETVPMFLPFRDNDQGVGLRHVMQRVAKHIHSQLFKLVNEKEGMGGYHNSWAAFQFELAVEELFYGRPVCSATRRFSAAMGVSSTNANSLTRWRGFLGLAPIGSASVGESPPPLEIWFRDEVQKARVSRVFPLTDCLQAGSDVIGEALIKVLLGDLYERNEFLPVETWRGPDPPLGKLVDCRSISELCKDLLERKGFGYPHTFKRAAELVVSAGRDVELCLQLAFSSFKFFPKIVYWDEHRNPKAKWNKRDFIELHSPTETPSLAARAASLKGDVCSKIEKLGLSYSKNLDKYRERGMPWLEKCLARLPKGMPREKLVDALAFISSVAMIHNHDYISFGVLAEFSKQLPVTQRTMQQLHILSNLMLLPHLNIWRLHESLPFKIPDSAPVPVKPVEQKVVRQPHEEPIEELVEIQDEIREEVVDRIDVSTVPAGHYGKWSALEVSFIDLRPELSHVEAYKMYLQKCQSRQISAHMLESFKRKRRRILNAS